MRSRFLVAVTAFLLLLPHPQAWAWGNEGHRIIADIAWDHLNDATLAKTAAIPGRQRSGLHLHLGGRHPQRAPGDRSLALRRYPSGFRRVRAERLP